MASNKELTGSQEILTDDEQHQPETSKKEIDSSLERLIDKRLNAILNKRLAGKRKINHTDPGRDDEDDQSEEDDDYNEENDYDYDDEYSEMDHNNNEVENMDHEVNYDNFRKNLVIVVNPSNENMSHKNRVY